ncbi:MAG: hypothetical protein IKP49_02055 [Treponema sp.]|nr:hypothetical protein [Treponema sp.]
MKKLNESMKSESAFFRTIGGIVAAFLFGIAFSSMFFSCADSSPSLVRVFPSVILDYADAESLPSAKFAVFLKTNSDNRRAESFVLKNIDDPMNLEWRVSSPKVVTIDNNKYVFADNLCSVGSPMLKKGRYRLFYQDSAGQEANIDFNLSYNDDLFSFRSDEIKKHLGVVTENIAIYDEFNMLLYIGKPKSNWSSRSNILKDYKNASFWRTVYFTGEQKLVCLMPTEKIGE